MNIDVQFSLMLTQQSSPSFVSLKPPASAVTNLRLADGTIIQYDKKGRLVFADYTSGVKVAKYDALVFITSVDGTHWVGSSGGSWFTLN